MFGRFGVAPRQVRKDTVGNRSLAVAMSFYHHHSRKGQRWGYSSELDRVGNGRGAWQTRGMDGSENSANSTSSTMSVWDCEVKREPNALHSRLGEFDGADGEPTPLRALTPSGGRQQNRCGNAGCNGRS